MGRDSSNIIVTDYGLSHRDLIPGYGQGFFSSPLRPDPLWARQVSYLVVIGRLFPRDNVTGTRK